MTERLLKLIKDYRDEGKEVAADFLAMTVNLLVQAGRLPALGNNKLPDQTQKVEIRLDKRVGLNFSEEQRVALFEIYRTSLMSNPSSRADSYRHAYCENITALQSDLEEQPGEEKIKDYMLDNNWIQMGMYTGAPAGDVLRDLAVIALAFGKLSAEETSAFIKPVLHNNGIKFFQSSDYFDRSQITCAQAVNLLQKFGLNPDRSDEGLIEISNFETQTAAARRVLRELIS